MSKKDLYKDYRHKLERDQQDPTHYADGAPVYWKSPEAFFENDEVKKWAELEFPNGLAPEEFGDVTHDGQDSATGFGRRDALKLLGASLGLAGVSACVRRPEEAIMPFTKQPEYMVPGVSAYYATTVRSGRHPVAAIARSNEGRPTMLHGNPDHPSSHGSIGTGGYASVLDLYDPDRIQTPMQGDAAKSLGDFDRFLEDFVDELKDGSGVAFVVGTLGGPSQWRALDALAKRFPKAAFYLDAPGQNVHEMEALASASVPNGRAHYDLKSVQIAVSLDADFLVNEGDALGNAAGFGEKRSWEKINDGASAKDMNRLYVVESTFSPTGSAADNRFRVASGEMGDFAKALAKALGMNVGSENKFSKEKFLVALANDLKSNSGKAAIVVGDKQPAAVHALVHAINAHLKAPVSYTSPAAVGGAYALDKSTLLERAKAAGVRIPSASTFATEDDFVIWLSEALENDADTNAARQAQAKNHWSLKFRRGQGGLFGSLEQLKSDLEADKIATLISIGGNPVYHGQAYGLGGVWSKAKTHIRLALYRDESAAGASWLLPLAHDLESWDDAVSFSGDLLAIQPLVKPIFQTISSLELLLKLAGKNDSQREWVMSTWKACGIVSNETDFKKILHNGFSSEISFEKSTMPDMAQLQAMAGKVSSSDASESDYELVITPDYKLGFGAQYKNGWLLELPDPMTKLSWDNALLMSPALANKLGVKSGVYKNSYQAEVVEVSNEKGTVKAPVFVYPGLAENTVHATLGWGREAYAFTGDVYGVDFSPLQTRPGSSFSKVTIKKTGETRELAATQDHFTIENQSPIQELKILNDGFQEKRPLALSAQAETYVKEPEFAKKSSLRVISGGKLVEEKFNVDNPSQPDRPLQMTSEVFDYSTGQQWGMVIDLTACTGCNACVVACQAENNIPIVGRDSVLMGRELHWLRIDRYFVGDVDNPETISQAVGCLHCENAPCEPVCPVAATVHDTEGTNAMVYNRCIGTRYCANNCPVKVRRFNYFDFTRTGDVFVDAADEERYRYLQLQRNPDVTVRYRGVMEKCSYCVQTVNEAKMAAKRAGRDPNKLPDGAVTPACARACPSNGIVFGNINDPKSKVAQAKALDRNYEMLSELNIRPRTTYLAKIKNSNPELG